MMGSGSAVDDVVQNQFHVFGAGVGVEGAFNVAWCGAGIAVLVEPDG